jgi:CubicO group peptidase (beta-lactamase class C family)
MAKFGYLYLNNGFWDGKQIISADFINKSTHNQIKTNWLNKDYGYLWWIDKVEEHPGYFAAGYRGEFIYNKIYLKGSGLLR